MERGLSGRKTICISTRDSSPDRITRIFLPLFWRCSNILYHTSRCNLSLIHIYHFAQILLIQIVLIAVFFGVAFYVFQKSDMAKRNNFMYFPWMEHLFVWIFPFCVSLFIVVTGFKIQSYTGGILAAVIATIIYYIVEKRKKRRAV